MLNLVFLLPVFFTGVIVYGFFNHKPTDPLQCFLAGGCIALNAYLYALCAYIVAIARVLPHS